MFFQVSQLSVSNSKSNPESWDSEFKTRQICKSSRQFPQWIIKLPCLPPDIWTLIQSFMNIGIERNFLCTCKSLFAQTFWAYGDIRPRMWTLNRNYLSDLIYLSTHNFEGAQPTHLLTTVPPELFSELTVWRDSIPMCLLSELIQEPRSASQGSYTVFVLQSSTWANSVCKSISLGLTKSNYRHDVCFCNDSERFYGRSEIVDSLVPWAVHSAHASYSHKYREGADVNYKRYPVVVCTGPLLFSRVG